MGNKRMSDGIGRTKWKYIQPQVYQEEDERVLAGQQLSD